jgi:hypothetical protein
LPRAAGLQIGGLLRALVSLALAFQNRVDALLSPGVFCVQIQDGAEADESIFELFLIGIQTAKLIVRIDALRLIFKASAESRNGLVGSHQFNKSEPVPVVGVAVVWLQLDGPFKSGQCLGWPLLLEKNEAQAPVRIGVSWLKLQAIVEGRNRLIVVLHSGKRTGQTPVTLNTFRIAVDALPEEGDRLIHLPLVGLALHASPIGQKSEVGGRRSDFLVLTSDF